MSGPEEESGLMSVLMASPDAAPLPQGGAPTEVLSMKEEFFRNLNLLATERVKIKYCRTIKERLRASTIEESLSLPRNQPKVTLSPSPSILPSTSSGPASSPVARRRPPPVQTSPLIRGGLSVIQSLKKKKKTVRLIKSNTTPPSTKSLLSYLQPKEPCDTENPENDVDIDSSSFETESDSNDLAMGPPAADASVKLRSISVSVNRLSPAVSNLFLQRKRVGPEASGKVSRSPRSTKKSPAARTRLVIEEENICGFSNEMIPEKTFAKNEQLKNLISDLESDISEKERETRVSFHQSKKRKSVVRELMATTSYSTSASSLLTIHSSQEDLLRRKIVEDFGIESEPTTDSEDNDDLHGFSGFAFSGPQPNTDTFSLERIALTSSDEEEDDNISDVNSEVPVKCESSIKKEPADGSPFDVASNPATISFIQQPLTINVKSEPTRSSPMLPAAHSGGRPSWTADKTSTAPLARFRLKLKQTAVIVVDLVIF